MLGLCAPITLDNAPIIGGYPITLICNYYGEWKIPGNAWNPNPWRKGTMGSRMDRHPLIGGAVNQDDQAIIDAEIMVASSYGVDVFDFDWWWAGSPSADGGYNDYAVRRFKQSANAGLMKFCVRPIVNGWAGSPSDFKALLRALKLNFSHPSYYLIGNRPVVFWFGLDDVCTRYLTLGGYTNIEAATYAVVRDIRSLLGPCFIVGASDPHSYYVGKGKFNERVGYDAVSSWISLREWSSGVPAWNWDILPNNTKTYGTAVEETEKAITWIYSVSGTSLPYIPMIMVGRDGTPWNDGLTLWGSTLQQWENHCASVRKIIDRWPKTSMRILSLYSWNEYGEGGVLAPTITHKYAQLEVVRRVFKPYLIK